MIVPITGKVTYPITLDPTVWIFDDRKIEFDKAFENTSGKVEEDELKKAAERFNREVYQHAAKPPVNRSIKKFEREKILQSTYVMPLEDFIANAEVSPEAENVTLVTKEDEIIISLPELQQSYFLFARDGKPLKDDGPVHLYFQDGSNKSQPIKSITKIVIN
ncbi:hypothetical protein ACDX78_00630 [Virgibacillus oceani]